MQWTERPEVAGTDDALEDWRDLAGAALGLLVIVVASAAWAILV